MTAELSEVRDDVRNIAIVAHVDHGKTTLVDALIQETDLKDSDKEIGKDDRIMDSNDQERERGITILAKNAAVTYGGIKINIVDTPGHADFGGEVERVLNMVDGVLLVVDAQEGPKPQTRFVLKKALAMGHKVLVVVNKVDKPAAQPDAVIDRTFDLFCELGASDEQTDFQVVYTSALNRVAAVDVSAPAVLEDMGPGMTPLLDAILELPKPVAAMHAPLQLQISNVGSDAYIGRLGVGRIMKGTLEPKREIGLSAGPGRPVRRVKLSDVFVFNTTGRIAVEQAHAGDIVVFAGIDDFDIGNTLVDLASPQPLEPIEIEQPTMSITMGVNRSPFKGKSGAKLLTSRQIKDRLQRELEVNLALKVEDAGDADTVQLYGRGLLHLTVLIESMRREGFELMVGPPKVLEQMDGGERREPYETVDIELPEQYAGAVIDLLNSRKGDMVDMGVPTKEGMQTLLFEVPSRGLVGVKSRMLTATRGEAVMTATFAGYKRHAGPIGVRERGNLLSSDSGTVTAYALDKAADRGVFFSRPGEDVYRNQIIGINAKKEDLVLNICKGKELNNIRTTSKEDGIRLTPPKDLSLEDAVEYVTGDEMVEITPDAIRMLKPGR